MIRRIRERGCFLEITRMRIRCIYSTRKGELIDGNSTSCGIEGAAQARAARIRFARDKIGRRSAAYRGQWPLWHRLLSISLQVRDRHRQVADHSWPRADRLY